MYAVKGKPVDTAPSTAKIYFKNLQEVTSGLDKVLLKFR